MIEKSSTTCNIDIHLSFAFWELVSEGFISFGYSLVELLCFTLFPFDAYFKIPFD
jgi:hypothetical protein